MPDHLKLPVQVVVASAIALTLGLLLSPVRWYWAVITAFIVFNNTQSRSDTAVRALQRAGGTLAGLIVGSLMATLLAGHAALSIGAILLLFFTGFYFVQISYSVMIFCVTVALALIYGVMGMFTPQLLLLRLEETVIGALAGAGVAFFLFANHTSTTIETKLDAYLDALAALVDAVDKRIGEKDSDDDPVALSRAIDRAYSDLAAAAKPMGGPWRAVTRFGAVREKLLFLTGCAHWARSLARNLAGRSALDADMSKRCDGAITEVRERIDTARKCGSELFGHSARDDRVIFEQRQRAAIAGEADSPSFALEMIIVLMRRVTS